MKPFLTIATAVENVLLKEKGSKFIGYAAPVSDEKSISEALNEIKKIHPKATHHCYAYRLAGPSNLYRTNDDGEPTGSAGLPIYNQILAQELFNVLVIVVRYYGGTKLGVSGLIKAYKECAKETLLEAKIISQEPVCQFTINFPFQFQNQIFVAINKFNGKIINFESHEHCMMLAEIPEVQKENISKILSEMPSVDFIFS